MKSTFSPLTFSLLFLILFQNACALRILVAPVSTVNAVTPVYWVKEASDPATFDIRFVINGQDVGLAKANINVDGVGGDIGKGQVVFPKPGTYMLEAVTGPTFSPIGSSNQVVVSSAGTISLVSAPSTSSTISPTSTSSSTPSSTLVPSSTTPLQKSKVKTRAIIAGAVVGALVFAAALLPLILFLLRRRRAQKEEKFSQERRLSFHPDEMVQRRSRFVSAFSLRSGGTGAGGITVVKGEPVAAEFHQTRDRASHVHFVGVQQVQHQQEQQKQEQQKPPVLKEEIEWHPRRSWTPPSRVTTLSRYSTSMSSSSSTSSGFGGGSHSGESGLGSEMGSEDLGLVAGVVIPPSPPRVLLVRALPAIPQGPAFDYNLFGSQEKVYASVSELAVIGDSKSGDGATPVPPASASASLSPTPVPPPSTPTPDLTPTPTRRALPRVPRTPRQLHMERRLVQVKEQMEILEQRVAEGKVEQVIGARVKKDMEKQVEWLEETMEGPWAKGQDNILPVGFTRFMTP